MLGCAPLDLRRPERARSRLVRSSQGIGVGGEYPSGSASAAEAANEKMQKSRGPIFILVSLFPPGLRRNCAPHDSSSSCAPYLMHISLRRSPTSFSRSAPSSPASCTSSSTRPPAATTPTTRPFGAPSSASRSSHRSSSSCSACAWSTRSCTATGPSSEVRPSSSRSSSTGAPSSGRAAPGSSTTSSRSPTASVSPSTSSSACEGDRASVASEQDRASPSSRSDAVTRSLRSSATPHALAHTLTLAQTPSLGHHHRADRQGVGPREVPQDRRVPAPPRHDRPPRLPRRRTTHQPSRASQPHDARLHGLPHHRPLRRVGVRQAPAVRAGLRRPLRPHAVVRKYGTGRHAWIGVCRELRHSSTRCAAPSLVSRALLSLS